MLKAFFIFVFIYAVFQYHTQAQQIYPVQLPNGGEAGGRVNCIFQDKTGFIWIGKETGLLRFDGIKYRII